METDSHKLDIVREAREARANGASYRELADRYGVSYEAARHWCTGQAYPDAGGPLAPVRVQLSPERVREMRRDRAGGMSLKELAEKYGRRSLVHISKTCNGARHTNACGPVARLRVRMSPARVREMRFDRARGMTLKIIAKKYGLAVSHACQICRGNLHKDAGGPLTRATVQP
jgi:transposase